LGDGGLWCRLIPGLGLRFDFEQTMILALNGTELRRGTCFPFRLKTKRFELKYYAAADSVWNLHLLAVVLAVQDKVRQKFLILKGLKDTSKSTLEMSGQSSCHMTMKIIERKLIP
jgi:hypothetical protein